MSNTTIKVLDQSNLGTFVTKLLAKVRSSVVTAKAVKSSDVKTSGAFAAINIGDSVDGNIVVSRDATHVIALDGYGNLINFTFSASAMQGITTTLAPDASVDAVDDKVDTHLQDHQKNWGTSAPTSANFASIKVGDIIDSHIVLSRDSSTIKAVGIGDIGDPDYAVWTLRDGTVSTGGDPLTTDSELQDVIIDVEAMKHKYYPQITAANFADIKAGDYIGTENETMTGLVLNRDSTQLTVLILGSVGEAVAGGVCVYTLTGGKVSQTEKGLFHGNYDSVSSGMFDYMNVGDTVGGNSIIISKSDTSIHTLDTEGWLRGYDKTGEQLLEERKIPRIFDEIADNVVDMTVGDAIGQNTIVIQRDGTDKAWFLTVYNERLKAVKCVENTTGDTVTEHDLAFTDELPRTWTQSEITSANLSSVKLGDNVSDGVVIKKGASNILVLSQGGYTDYWLRDGSLHTRESVTFVSESSLDSTLASYAKKADIPSLSYMTATDATAMVESIFA